MTSLRYSNDKTDIKDFFRSFLKTIPYSAFALAVLCTYFVFPVFGYVTSKEFKASRPNDIISYFGDSPFIGIKEIQIGMIFCGLIIAVSLFRFMFSKKSVNVYFSMGITRSRLYINRIIAGVISLCLAVIIPLTITLIINISVFGSNSHIFNVFFYDFLAVFTCGLSGFAIGAFASTVSGSIIEAVITSGSVAFIPIFFDSVISSVNSYMLRGFSNSISNDLYGSNFSSIFSPFTFIIDLNKKRCRELGEYNPIERLSALLEGTKVPKEYLIDIKILGPVIFWLVASIVFIGIGLMLMNSRKAENSNTLGKFYVSSAINGVTVYSVAFMVLSEITLDFYAFRNNTFSVFYQNLSLCLLVCGIGLIIAFFVGELIIRRKFKAALRTLPVFALLFALTIFGAVYVASEHFGTYNKLPATSSIKAVSMDINDSNGIFYYSTGQSDNDYESKDPEDIKLAVELFNKIKDDKYDGTNTPNYALGFNFTLNDGTVIRRSFDVFSPDLVLEYDKSVYESNYYKGFLKSLLIDDYIEYDKESDVYYDEYGNMYNYDYADDTYRPGKYRTVDWCYVGPNSLFEGYDRSNGITDIPIIEDNDGLCKALYKDLIKMPYDKVFNNTTRPLGMLMLNFGEAFYFDETYVLDWDRMVKETDYMGLRNDNYTPDKRFNAGYACSGIYIYPEMTETIKFLKDNGYEFVPFTAKVKEVYFADTKISLDSASKTNAKNLLEKDKKFKEYSYYFDFDRGALNNFWFNYSLSSVESPYFPYINNAMNKEGEYKEIYSNLFTKTFEDAGIKLNKITDTKKAAEIVSKAVPFMKNIANDDGRFIYIVYDNGVITEEYIPSSNTGVLK